MVAYGSFVVLLFILAAGVLTIIIAPIVNQTADFVNNEIDDGALSTKYVTWFDLIMGFAKAIPIFALLGVTAWAIVRALEKRGEESL